MSVRSPRWFERVLGPRLNLKELNVICWCLFFFFLAPAIFRAVQMQRQHGKPIQYADFVNFYAMGRILNEYPATDLYDLALQNRICNEIAPPRKGSYGPIPYPPFVGIPFKLLARLPYSAAYTVWLLIFSVSLSRGPGNDRHSRFYRGEPLPAVSDPLRRPLLFPIHDRNACQWTTFDSRFLLSGARFPSRRLRPFVSKRIGCFHVCVQAAITHTRNSNAIRNQAVQELGWRCDRRRGFSAGFTLR